MIAKFIFSHRADVQDRTGDLVITNDVLYRLSYIGTRQEKPGAFAKQLIRF